MFRTAVVLALLGAALPCSAATLSSASRLPSVTLTAPDYAARLARETRLASSRQPRPFLWAVPVESPLPTLADGRWETVDGTAYWRLPLHAAGARSLSVALRAAGLPADARIRIDSLDGHDRRGPYAASDFSGGRLQLPLVRGERALLTLSVPAGSETAVDLDIARIDYGFRDFDDTLKADAGGCNVDILCPAGEGWQDAARAVARYTVSHAADGTYLCSGTLVNNTAHDGAPYFLTADHCFRSEEGEFAGDPDSLVLYWNYQAPSCDSNSEGDLTQTQSGATLRANSGVSDFALLELDTTPPPAYQVHYAGWDRRNLAPTSGTGIHHPRGDVKKISVEYDAPTITDYSSNEADSSGDFLRVANWDVGVTESGSSGSALFSDSRHLVGTLTGGRAACNVVGNDNGQPDWYGRLYSHWNRSTSTGASVKSWLDPCNSGVSTLDGGDAGALIAGCDNGGSSGDDSSGGGGPWPWPASLLLALAALARIRRA